MGEEATLVKFQESLENEIKELEKEQSEKRPIHIINGERIFSAADGSVYRFSLPQVKNIPSSYAKVTIGATTYSGYVNYCEEKTIELSIDNFFDLKVESAELEIDSTHLLETLLEHFKNVRRTDNPITSVLKELQDNPPLDVGDFQVGDQAALNHAKKENELTVIWGPPGTGKTQILARIAMEVAEAGNRVLIISTSNISVDTAVLRIGSLYSEEETKGKVLRYGCVFDKRLREHPYLSAGSYVLNSNEELKKKLDECSFKMQSGQKLTGKEYNEVRETRDKAQAELRGKEISAIRSARVVATTVTKSYMDSTISGANWDYVLFDEVSMAYVQNVFVAASLAKKKLVLIGDFEQLPAISTTDSPFLEMNIFEYLKIYEEGKVHRNPYMVMLNIQRRMHSEISAFVRDNVYQGLLEDDQATDERLKNAVAMAPFSCFPVTLVDYSGIKTLTSKAQSSRINVTSGLISAKLAIEASKPEILVGIICPYAPQAEFINSILSSIEHEGRIICSTVHQFQGNEADVIIFDAVESPIGNSSIGQMFTSRQARRLVNVAVTRARAKLIVVANRKFFFDFAASISGSLVLELIDYAGSKHSVAGYNSVKTMLSEMEETKVISFFNGVSDAKQSYLNDMKQATRAEYWNHGKNEVQDDPQLSFHELKTVMQQFAEKNNSRKVQIYKPSKKSILDQFVPVADMKKPDGIVYSDFSLFDGKILWFGVPRFIVKGRMDFNFVFRIESEDAVHTLNSLLELDELRYERNPNAKAKKYLEAHQRCSKCNSVGTLKVVLSQDKKYYLKCKNCNNGNYIDDKIMTEFLASVGAKCSGCKGNLEVLHTRFGDHIIRCSRRKVMTGIKHSEPDFLKVFEK